MTSPEPVLIVTTYVQRCTGEACPLCAAYCPLPHPFDAPGAARCDCDHMLEWWQDLHYNGVRQLNAKGGDNKMSKYDEQDEGTEVDPAEALRMAQSGRKDYLKLTEGATVVAFKVGAKPKVRTNRNFTPAKEEVIIEVLHEGSAKVLTPGLNSPLAVGLLAALTQGLKGVTIMRRGMGQSNTRYDVLNSDTMKPIVVPEV